MEIETECLLDTEILGDGQTTESTDEVSGMLLDGGEVNGGASCISSTMDFGFTHTDLGSASDFSIDHSSMFDISESVIDEKGDCGYLFKDTSIFDDVHVKQSGEIDSLTTASCANKKASICNDLGLRLQIIPLNNLQFVSTIQTSEGLHILAIPAGSSLSVIPQLSSLIGGSQSSSLVSQAEETVNFSLQQPEQNLPCSLEAPISHRNAHEIISSSPGDVPRTEAVEQIVHETSNSLISMPVAEPANLLVTQDGVQVTQIDIPAKKKSILLPPKTHKVISQMTKARISSFTNKMKSVDGRVSFKQRSKVCKESKIVIDLRKLAQTRKKHMVSLLNNPKTKNLLHMHSQKLKNENEKCVKLKHAELGVNKKQVETNHKINSVNSEHPKNGVSIEKQQSLKTNKGGNEGMTTKKQDLEPQNNSKSTERKISKSSKVKHRLDVNSGHVKTKKTFKCRICFSKFNREGNFNNHILLHECSDGSNLPNTSDSNDNNGKEKKEAEELQDKTGLVETVGEDFPVAEVTDKVLVTAKTVTEFRCELCSMLFTTEGNLTRHKLTHSMSAKHEARFSCEVCQRSFLQRCDLRRHQLTHTGQYPYTCSMCNKGFIRRSDVTVHERFHLKEKTFRCDQCSKAYYQSGDLHRHIRKNHSSQCEYMCTQCDRRYSTQKSLNQHLNKHMRQRK